RSVPVSTSLWSEVLFNSLRDICDLLIMRTSCILNSSPGETYILSQIDQRGHDVAECRVLWLSKPEIKLLIEWIQGGVGCMMSRLRRKNGVGRLLHDGVRRKIGVLSVELLLSHFYRFEITRREESKNRGSQTSD